MRFASKVHLNSRSSRNLYLPIRLTSVPFQIAKLNLTKSLHQGPMCLPLSWRQSEFSFYCWTGKWVIKANSLGALFPFRKNEHIVLINHMKAKLARSCERCCKSSRSTSLSKEHLVTPELLKILSTQVKIQLVLASAYIKLRIFDCGKILFVCVNTTLCHFDELL